MKKTQITEADVEEKLSSLAKKIVFYIAEKQEIYKEVLGLRKKGAGASKAEKDLEKTLMQQSAALQLDVDKNRKDRKVIIAFRKLFNI